jgi:hypothetical protein
MPPHGTDDITAYRVVQICSVTEAEDSRENDVGINPEGCKILHIRVEKYQIGTMAHNLPSQHVPTRNDSPNHPKLLDQPRRTLNRIREAGNLRKIGFPTTQKGG